MQPSSLNPLSTSLSHIMHRKLDLVVIAILVNKFAFLIEVYTFNKTCVWIQFTSKFPTFPHIVSSHFL